MLTVDLNTFICTDRCDELCRPAKTEACSALRQRLGKFLSNERPIVWEYVSEKSKSWSPKERDQVLAVLERLPEKLRERAPFKLHRMPTSKAPKNSGATLNNSIVLYDAAFTNQNVDRVIAHELAHVFFNSLREKQQQAYEIAARWGPFGKNPRPGRSSKEFVEVDGMDSPEEDFANNVEYMLFEPDRLKARSPAIYRWLSAFFGDSLKIGGRCRDR